MAKVRTLHQIDYLQNLALRAIGFDVRRPPMSLIEHPDARLTIDLDHLIALRMLKDPNIFFVQIGAFDGRTGDQIHPYVTKYGWRGIAVEPQPRYFEALRDTYSGYPGVQLRNVAVAPRAGTRTLYAIDPDVPGLPAWTGGIASLDRSHLERANVHGQTGKDLITKLTVECVTVPELLSGVERIDLLQVDVEGFDAEVIRQFPFDSHRPSIVRFESLCLSQADHEDAVARLIECDYKVAVTGVDTIAWSDAD